jgi:hypothetical protein
VDETHGPGEGESSPECPNCGGDIRLIAFIAEPRPIRKILVHLGESLEPPVSTARGPPDSERLGADARETLIQGGRQAGLERPGASQETGARESRAAHQLGNRCDRAIGRAILMTVLEAVSTVARASSGSRRDLGMGSELLGQELR